MDPTEQAEKIIDKRQSRYKTIFENTGTATVIIEDDMTISMVNSELERISGIKKSRVEGQMKFPELIARSDRAKVIINHRLRRQSGAKVPRNYPCRVIVANDEIKECILTVALIQGTCQSVASITDISKQKHLEQEISRISEEERQHTGQMLHDDLGSHLAGVEAMSALLAGRLEKQGHEDASLAREITVFVNQAIEKTRSIIQGLVPVNFADMGFINALKRYCQEVERAFGITCQVLGREQEVRFSNTEALTHIYYIIRESVHNAARHGDAGEIQIRFDEEFPDMVLHIEDDGKGIGKAESEDKKGTGLVIMQHRADLIGARLRIIETLSGGTLVQCRIKKKYLL